MYRNRKCPRAVVSLNRVRRSVRPVRGRRTRWESAVGVDGQCTPGGSHAAALARRGRRPGSSAEAGFAAAAARRRLRRGVGHPLRSAGHRQDDAGVADLQRHRPPVRGIVGTVGRRQGGPCRHRHRAPRRRLRRADGAVHRRGAPLLQDAAGRTAGRRREPGGAAGGRHHGEPVVLGGGPAAVALADPATAAAERRRDPCGHRAGRRRSSRPRWCHGRRRRCRRPAGAAGRRRRAPRADRPRGRGRSG